MEVGRFYSTRKLTKTLTTLAETVEAVAETTTATSIVVIPPDAGDSSADSDVEQVPDELNNEVPFEAAGMFQIEELVNENEEDDSDVAHGATVKPGQKRKRADTSTWKKAGVFKSEIPFEAKPELQHLFPMLSGLQPIDMWQLLFDKATVDNLLDQTRAYAAQEKNCPEFSIDRYELLRFLGILIVSGYHTLPEETHYWSNQLDLGVPVVSEAMSSKRFSDIKRYFHIADNSNLQEGNKAAKVLPLYNSLNHNLVQFGIWHSSLSIDESMVPYYGRHSIKMFIRGKPIRFGYKLWCLCGPDGFPYHLQIYTGKHEQDANQPLGSRVVNHMVNVIEENSATRHHQLFFDNFFTSHGLLSSLADRQMRATGTVRENRTNGATEKLMDNKEMKKKGRGHFDFVCDGRVYVMKWNDNSIVTMASNYLNHEPVQTAVRRVKGQSNVSVRQPFIVRQYNVSMGGVDLMDRLLASYRPMIRGKKWWWPLFLNALNVSIVAAWRIHCAVADADQKQDHLSFRRSLAISLLKAGPESERRQVGGGHQADLPPAVRYDGVGHTRVQCSQGRCRVCSKNTTVMCAKCCARLHSDRGKTCFVDYHTS